MKHLAQGERKEKGKKLLDVQPEVKTLRDRLSEK